VGDSQSVSPKTTRADGDRVERIGRYGGYLTQSAMWPNRTATHIRRASRRDGAPDEVAFSPTSEVGLEGALQRRGFQRPAI
jgi:hypothetical protein